MKRSFSNDAIMSVIIIVMLSLVLVVAIHFMDQPQEEESYHYMKGSDGKMYRWVEFDEKDIACVIPPRGKGPGMCFQYD